jgi:glucose/arabinose dehydrogenase
MTAAATRRPRRRAVLALVLGAALVAGCGGGGDGGEGGDGPTGRAAPAAPPGFGAPQVLLTGLDTPWGLAFLPDGTALLSERDSARILHVRPTDDGRSATSEEVARVPGVDPRGEGGLLGLAVSPAYASDHLVYAYLSAADENRIVRFPLGSDRVETVLDGIPRASIHNGGRLAFGPDGMLYATTGDAGDRLRAPDRASPSGKILRLRPDGTIPPDNPFAGSPVWSYGHRNVEGLAWDSAGRMFASEFGQNRVDEVNRIERGRDYGWPAMEGDEPTGEGTPAADAVPPLLTWPTSEASPSGAAIRDGFLYVAGLRGERLWRLTLGADGGVSGPTPLLDGAFGRLRTVAVAPDGALWIATSNRDGRGDPDADDDRLIRLPPA